MKYIFVGKRNVRNKLENETACCAQIAQSVEQETENLRVRGSIPSSPANYTTGERGVAQFGSASGLGPEGRGFKSCRPDLEER